MSSHWQASTQYHLYGRSYFTASRATSRRVNAELAGIETLSGQTVVIADGCSCMSEELACFAAVKNARLVVLICASLEHGTAMAQRVMATACTLQVEVIIADVSLVTDAKRACEELRQLAGGIVDCLLINMDGVSTADRRTFTSEGHETTFAKYLLGPYALVSAAMPLLRASERARVVFVTAGALYNTAFPSLQIGCGREGEYHAGEMHAYARRGQVLLTEAWARHAPTVCFVSALPGWVRTLSVKALVDAAGMARMQPFRSEAQGAEGICWLLGAPREQLQNGGCFLDCRIQPTHLAGAFFTEGWVTKNTPAEVVALFNELEATAKDTRAGLPPDVNNPLPRAR